jgi:hypothetical protein
VVEPFSKVPSGDLETNRSRLEEPARDEDIKRIAQSICRYAPRNKCGLGRAVSFCRSLNKGLVT